MLDSSLEVAKNLKVIVGQGETYEAALADLKSAIQFHLETFGLEDFPEDSTVLEAFVAETTLNP